MRPFFSLLEQAGADGTPSGGSGTQTAPAGQGAAPTTLLGAASPAVPATTTAQGGAAAAPVAPVEPFYKDWLKADGTINAAAYDRLPDHLKPAAESLKKYGKIEEVLGAFWHHQQLVGKKGLTPLPANADENAKKEFSSRLREILHVPENPDGYGVKKPADLPDALWNEPVLKGALAIMHKHNLPPEGVKELLDYNFKFGKENMAQFEAEQGKQVEQAKAEVQQAFGSDYDKKIALAQRGAKTLGLDVTDPSIGNNPKVIIAMARMAELISEDKLVTGASDTNRGLTDRAKALDVVNNAANPLHKAYHDANDPQHQLAVDQVMRFNQAFHDSQRKVS